MKNRGKTPVELTLKVCKGARKSDHVLDNWIKAVVLQLEKGKQNKNHEELQRNKSS